MILTVVFLIAGQWLSVDGWGPRAAPDAETCAARAEYMTAYLATISPYEFRVTCE